MIQKQLQALTAGMSQSFNISPYTCSAISLVLEPQDGPTTVGQILSLYSRCSAGPGVLSKAWTL